MVLTRRGRSTGGGDKPARPARKEEVPEKQTPAVLALCAVGILLAFVAFLLGCGGVAVLMDEPERAHWYSQNQFGETWRWLTQKNPFYMTICVNGGMVVMLWLCTRVWEHCKALKLEKRLQKKVKAVKKAE